MKISSIICAALLTVASADAAAPILKRAPVATIHKPDGVETCRGSGQVCGIKAKLKRAPVAAIHKPDGVETCRGSGQVCGIKAKLKRAAEAAAQMDASDALANVTESLKSKRAPVAAIHKPDGVETCRGSGQVCGIKAKLKRAADDAADALAERITFAEPPHRFCYTPGGECSNAKREALALAEAAAEAYAIAEPTADPCYLPGGECSNAKREAIAAAESMAERDASAFPDSEAEASANNDFCNLPNESCTKLRRATASITEAIAGLDGDLGHVKLP